MAGEEVVSCKTHVWFVVIAFEDYMRMSCRYCGRERVLRKDKNKTAHEQCEDINYKEKSNAIRG